MCPTTLQLTDWPRPGYWHAGCWHVLLQSCSWEHHVWSSVLGGNLTRWQYRDEALQSLLVPFLQQYTSSISFSRKMPKPTLPEPCRPFHIRSICRHSLTSIQSCYGWSFASHNHLQVHSHYWQCAWFNWGWCLVSAARKHDTTHLMYIKWIINVPRLFSHGTSI